MTTKDHKQALLDHRAKCKEELQESVNDFRDESIRKATVLIAAGGAVFLGYQLISLALSKKKQKQQVAEQNSNQTQQSAPNLEGGIPSKKQKKAAHNQAAAPGMLMSLLNPMIENLRQELTQYALQFLRELADEFLSKLLKKEIDQQQNSLLDRILQSAGKAAQKQQQQSNSPKE